MRANKQIWRVAKFLHEDVRQHWATPYKDEAYCSFEECHKSVRDFYYDRAAELLKKISNNDFTGGDNHRD